MKKSKIRAVFEYEFRHESKLSQVVRDINEVFSEDVASERTVGRWFEKYGSGDFNLESEAPGRTESKVQWIRKRRDGRIISCNRSIKAPQITFTRTEMLFFNILFFTFVNTALTNPSRTNCEGRPIDWHILVVENYHKDMKLDSENDEQVEKLGRSIKLIHLASFGTETFDCITSDLAAFAATDELLHPSAPQEYANSTEYCRYSRQTLDTSGNFGRKQVELLLNKMPKQRIMETVKTLGPTTYGCSTMRYNYNSLGNHAHFNLLCLYRKHAATQVC